MCYTDTHNTHTHTHTQTHTHTHTLTNTYPKTHKLVKQTQKYLCLKDFEKNIFIPKSVGGGGGT